MPNNPNQGGGGGGLFSRYAGMNMSPIPPGYMESVAQEANMYSSIGGNIANMLIKDSEMKLKEKEIAAQNLASNAATKKADNEADRIGLDRYKVDQKSRTDRLAARGTVLKDVSTSLTNEMGLIQSQLSKDDQVTDPAKKLNANDRAKLTARLSQITVDLGSTNTQFQEFLRKMTDEESAGDPMVPNPGGKPSKDPLSGLGGSIVDFVTRITQGGTVKPNIREGNPNSAPSATSGAEGGEGEIDDASTPSETELQFPQTVTPEPPAPVTAPVETPGKVEFNSFLNQTITQTRGLTVSKSGKTSPSPAKFVSRTTEDGTPLSPQLQVNEDSYVFDANGRLIHGENVRNLPEDIKDVDMRNLRLMHIMSWAMSKHPDLLSRIVPTDEEKKNAAEIFLNDENVRDVVAIQRAYAYAIRDRSKAPMNWSQGQLDAAFVDQFQVPTNDFVDLGADMFSMQSPNEVKSEIARSQGRFKLISGRVDDLIKKRSDLTSKSKTNPYTQKLYDAEAKVARLGREAEGVVGEIGDQMRRGVNTAQTELQSVQVAHTAWENENGAASVKAKADSYSREIEEQSRQLTVIKDLVSLGESEAKSIDRMSEKFSAWVGINPGDRERYWGYVASGVKNFAGFPTTVNGRPALYSAAEFRNWALRNPANEQDVSRVQGMYAGSWPKVETLTDTNVDGSVAKANIGMKNLAPQINQLFGLFTDLKKEFGINRGVESLTNPKYAGAQPLRAGLISLIRTAFIGGGNPSNFEQEILRETVPDPGAVFTVTEFNLNRMRGLALVVMMHHARVMEANGLEMTQDSLDAYNREFGKIIGKNLTMNDFKYFRGLTQNQNIAMQGMTPEQRNAYSKGRGAAVFTNILEEANKRFGDLDPQGPK